MYESPLHTLAPEEVGAVYALRSSDRGRLRRVPRSKRTLARLFDGRRTVAEICASGGVSLTSGLSLVEMLGRLRLLADVPSTAGRSSMLQIEGPESGFSELDEAFFASQVPDDGSAEAPPRAGTRVLCTFRQVADRVRGWSGWGSPGCGRRRAVVIARVGEASSG
jgi:hypothetical protein